MAAWELEQVGTRYLVLVDGVPHGVADTVEDARAEVFRFLQEKREAAK